MTGTTIRAMRYTPQAVQRIELSIPELYALLPVVTPGVELSLENKDSVIIPAGGPCALHSSGVGLLLAKASSPILWAFGLASGVINPTFAGGIKTTGLLTLSDWSSVTGTVSLIAKSIYYLAPNGGLTVEPGAGQILQQLGVAVTPDTLDIQVGQPILL